MYVREYIRIFGMIFVVHLLSALPSLILFVRVCSCASTNVFVVLFVLCFYLFSIFICVSLLFFRAFVFDSLIFVSCFWY